jgi:dihydroxy-acid dehydratase
MTQENVSQPVAGPQDSPAFWTRNRVELRAAGFDPDAAARSTAIVTIASAYTNAHRCNNRVREITDLLVQTLEAQGARGLIVGAPAVSDALTQGTPTAGFSLLSRDLAADCFEVGHRAHHGEAMIVVSGCDKTGAAAMIPLARTNAFGLVVYPGTSSPGQVSFEPYKSKGRNITILDWAEGRAAHQAGRLTDAQFKEIENNVMPGSGTCGAMFTANTMSTAAEAIGMMLPRGASHPADHHAGSPMHEDVRAQVLASVDALHHLMRQGIRPRDILTMRAFENAITTLFAMGGSTNMVLHLLALAYAAQVPLTIDHIHAVGARVPLIANLQPHGPYAMVSLHEFGGVPVVMKELLRAGLLHGDVMTVTGRTLAENLANVKSLADLQSMRDTSVQPSTGSTHSQAADTARPDAIVCSVDRPIAPPGHHISVLRGNLAPDSCVLKLSGKTLDQGEFRGRARVFESEAAAMQAIRAEAGTEPIVPGDVVVVRNVGPVGAPGMPEMVMLTVQLQGRGLGKQVALITDGRFSGVSHGILIGHISPEAARGGPIAAVRDGDTIVIDPVSRRLDVMLSDDQIAQRMKSWAPPDHSATVQRGSVQDKYIRLVSSAHEGCVL